MAWQDAATQNMPRVNYGQPAQQSQGTSGIFGTNGGSQNASIFSNSQQFNPYANSPNWLNPQPMSNPSPGQYPTMSGITGGNGNSNAAAQGNLAQFYAAQAANTGQRNNMFTMSQMPGTGGGDPGNGQPSYHPNAMGSTAFSNYPPQQPQMQPGQGQNQLLALLQQIMQQRGGQQQQGPVSGFRPSPWQDISMQQGPGGQYSYPGAQQGGQNSFNTPGARPDLGSGNRVMGYTPSQQESAYYAGMGNRYPAAQGGQQMPQQAPSGMSQQMPAFLQQLMQQRMMQQQMQQAQPQQSPGFASPSQMQYQMGGGMNTGMGMPQGQQSNPFLQMLMGMQGQGQQQQNSYPNYQNNPLTNGANLYRQYGNSFV